MKFYVVKELNLKTSQLEKPSKHDGDLEAQMRAVVSLAKQAGCDDAASFLKNYFNIWDVNDHVERQSKV